MSNAIPTARFQVGARLLLIQEIQPMTAGYKPEGTKNSIAYVSPGSLGCGIDSRPMNPTAEIQKGITTKGQRVFLRSASLAKR
jgi:hypothetical protein